MVRNTQKANGKLDYLKVALTKRCNYACSFCSQSDFLNNSTLRFSTMQERVLSRFLPRLIILTGGEPLMEPADVRAYVRYCSENDVELGIFTNMSLLTDELAREMSALPNLWLRTTVNGSCADTHEMTYPKGSYRKLEHAMDIALKNGLRVKARVTVARQNCTQIPDIMESVVKMGFREVDFRPYAPLSDNTHDEFMLPVSEHLRCIHTLLDLKEQWKSIRMALLPNWFEYVVLPDHEWKCCALCRCGKTYVYIDSNGDILTCAGYRNPLGNIRRDDLMEIFHGSEFLKQVRRERMGEYCRQCPAYDQCRKSNCHVVNYEVFQTVESVNPLCPIYRLSPEDPREGYRQVREIYGALTEDPASLQGAGCSEFGAVVEGGCHGPN